MNNKIYYTMNFVVRKMLTGTIRSTSVQKRFGKQVFMQSKPAAILLCRVM